MTPSTISSKWGCFFNRTVITNIYCNYDLYETDRAIFLGYINNGHLIMFTKSGHVTIYTYLQPCKNQNKTVCTFICSDQLCVQYINSFCAQMGLNGHGKNYHGNFRTWFKYIFSLILILSELKMHTTTLESITL